MRHFLLNGLFLSAAIKWGDWRNWRDDYPTILFFVLGDLLKNFLFYNYWMWTFQETIFEQNILQNHTFILLMIMVSVYPSTLLIFLGRFPEKMWQKGIWVALWIFIYSFIEYFIVYK